MIFRGSTRLQAVELIETRMFGRVLFLDGAIQLTTADEFVYHEMMAHVPLLAHGAVRRVLVVGGGDGGVAREVLRHPGVSSLTLVEIDGEVVDLCRRHLPEVSGGAFEDPRLTLRIADGIRFVRETDDRFDVIVVDSTDPTGPAAGLFSADFYRACRRVLTPGGILVTQAGLPFVQPDGFAATARALLAAFPAAAVYASTVPTYVGGMMAHGFAVADADAAPPDEAALAARLRAARLATRCYTPRLHAAAFALPAFVEAKLAGLRRAAGVD